MAKKFVLYTLALVVAAGALSLGFSGFSGDDPPPQCPVWLCPPR